ncbi:MAG TPA: hypothetical protein VGN74_08295 [Brevundimonas sp.]|jgi:hypothetical protein|uniref:hypothetical protein n=1 Tax=Brevundimonas sp. TaxID=1871086 RepID=UPI002E13E867|nr:hypothetical protein [Brevundimonas sp.]
MSLPPLSSQVFNGLGQTSGQTSQPSRAGQAAFFRAALGGAAAPAAPAAAPVAAPARPVLAPVAPEPAAAASDAAPLRRPGALLDIRV